MIEVKGLSKSYGDRPAIHNLNFKVNKGEVVGFLGPNGAGKSTTMKIITGYMAASEGSVKVAGYDVFENPIEVKRRIGYLPELPPVYQDMYVEDYLAYVARLRLVDPDKVKSRVKSALEKTNLMDVRSRLIQNLSKGFKQRVGLAQSLVSDPDVLILDEPTVGLDPVQVAEMRNLIQQLKGQHTIILSTHILPEVEASCEKVIIISKGRIVAEDSLSGLKSRMSGGLHVSLRVRRPELVEAALRSINGVQSVKTHGQDIAIDSHASETIMDDIASLVIAKKAGLLELKPHSMDLEDIFIDLTSSNKKGGSQS